jgi:hypothetical protein
MSLDELELALRTLRGVVAVGFVETDGMLVVEIQAGGDADESLPRDATVRAHEHASMPVAVEIVRWGGGVEPTAEPTEREARLRLLDVTTDPDGTTLVVRLANGDDTAVGRGAMDHGLLAAVEATVYAVRTFVPDLAFLPGWARVVETTPDRRFLVVASVTDPEPRRHLRGTAEGATPVEAAARATLAALNRTISRALLPHPR